MPSRSEKTATTTNGLKKLRLKGKDFKKGGDALRGKNVIEAYRVKDKDMVRDKGMVRDKDKSSLDLLKGLLLVPIQVPIFANNLHSDINVS